MCAAILLLLLAAIKQSLDLHAATHELKSCWMEMKFKNETVLLNKNKIREWK